MARAKRKKDKAKKGRDSGLETFLRFEIVVALFALIGFYYFLSFSPVRMPREPIRSPCQLLAPLPPAPEAKSADKAAEEVAVAEKSEVRGSSVAEEVSSSPEVGSEVNPVSSPVSDQVSEPGPAAVSGNENRNRLETEEVRETTLPVTPVAGADAALQEKSRSLSDSDHPAASNEKGSGSKNKAETAGRETPPPAIASSVTAEETTAPAPMAAVEPRAEKSVPPAVIVVGDYVLPDDFDRARARLEALGLAYRVERKKLPTPMYRVYLGPFPHRDQARKMLARSREMGDDPFLDKGPHGYQVIISSFYLQANVAAWQKKYRAAGLELKVLKEPLPIEHKILVVETTGLKEDPETLLARLQTAGFAKARLRPLPPSNPQKM